MRIYILISLLVFCELVSSQNTNLVANPSFEDYTICPTNQNGSSYFTDIHLLNWNESNYFATPDYLNSCSEIDTMQPWLNFPAFGTPINFGGFQYPNTGNAYVGIFTYYPPQANWMEYLQTKLVSKMKLRTKYLISFYCSLADTMRYSTSSLGVLLTDTLPLWNNGNLWHCTPQIVNEGGINPLTDKVSWTLVQDTFESNGGENYLIIGNFFDAAHSDTFSVTGSNPDYFWGAYYYIDDVSVIELDSTTGITEKEFTSYQIYPNPAQNTIAFKNKAPVSVSIYSLSGALLLSISIRKEEEIDISALSNGVYIVAIGNKRERLVVCR